MEIRKETIPVLSPNGDDADIAHIAEVIKSGWWINGPKVKEFEERFAKMVGSKYAIAVTSNTHGLDLILKSYDISNCEVISPTMSFATTCAVPMWNSCTNVLADIDPINMNIDPIDIKKKLTEKTKAIICVNLAGILAPVNEIRKFYDGLIIEDCAHACYTPGAGSNGDIAVWSFQAVKTMPTGDGGMITTNNEEIMKRIRKLYWFGIESTYDRVTKKQDSPGSNSVYKWQYDIDILGYKYYMIDLTAALGLSQMNKLESNLQRRQVIQTKYNEAFSLIPEIQIPPFSYTVQHYVIKVSPTKRNNLIDYLKEKNIHTSVHYRPLHFYTQFKDDETKFPIANTEWLKIITLPVHLNMSNDDIDYVIYWVKEFFLQ
jgi:perosamine synthetase